jgi:signal transduction histidine kinase
MNLLPRALGLTLLIVLVALAVVVFVPSRPPSSATPPAAARAVEATRRIAFPLALTGVALAAALLASLAFRRPASADSKPPFATARAEFGTLARLAETSLAQGEALAHERDVRRRAEQDALLNQQLLNRSLEEKIRLGRDLHDGIIQSLYAAGLSLESARALAKSNPAEAGRLLGQCRDNLNQTIRDVRAYITGLAPENLRQAGFAQAIATLAAELGAGREVRFDLKIDDAATALLSPDQNTETLQIAREAISNALRHGRASLITVRLHTGDGGVGLLVQDDGAGFDPAHRAAGHGLENIRARADRLGATLRVESQPGSGTRVIVTLPV